MDLVVEESILPTGTSQFCQLNQLNEVKEEVKVGLQEKEQKEDRKKGRTPPPCGTDTCYETA